MNSGPPNHPKGKLIVIGGGIGGIQCALDLADTGFFVYLIEKTHTLGGTMALLDKTFPTNDCSTCMFSPKLVQVAGHLQLHPFGRGALLAAAGALGTFGALGVITWLIDDHNLSLFIAYGVLATACYALFLRRFRHELELPLALQAFRRRRKRPARTEIPA